MYQNDGKIFEYVLVVKYSKYIFITNTAYKNLKQKTVDRNLTATHIDKYGRSLFYELQCFKSNFTGEETFKSQ